MLESAETARERML